MVIKAIKAKCVLEQIHHKLLVVAFLKEIGAIERIKSFYDEIYYYA